MRDNASTDNTQEVLTQIHDPRFRYVRGKEGITPLMNWLKALELGRGEWLFLVMGRDRINGEYISNLIELLGRAEEDGITYFYDGYLKKSCINKNKIIVYSGFEAVLRFVDWAHPTGAIFNGDLFRAIPRETREYYFTHSDISPEIYLKRDLLLKGKGASIMSGVFVWPSPIIDRAKIKSTVEPEKNLYDVWYAPRRRIVHFFELIDMVEVDIPDRFTKHELNRYFRRQFYTLIWLVSLAWRGLCGSFEWQAHYGQEVRHVGISEMLGNIKTCYRDTKSHLIEKGIYSRSKQMIMYWEILVVLSKIFVRVPLENLGVWRILRAVKKFLVRR